MPLSSINFARVSTHSFQHNDRTEKQTAKTVFKDKMHLNIFDVSAKDAKQNFADLYKNAISNITGRIRRAKKENTLIEAVVNIKPNTTMEDLKKLQKHIEKVFGFTGLQIAIHRDEGRYEEDGKFITNQHAHMSFFTLDRQTGQQMFRREHIKRDKLSELQTQTAKILNMDRGEKAEVTGRKRLGHKEYKEAKKVEAEREKKLLAKQKDLKEENVRLRAELKEVGATREDYAKLEQLNKELKQQIKEKVLTTDELVEKIKSLESSLLNSKKENTEIQESHDKIESKHNNFIKQDRQLQEVLDTPVEHRNTRTSFIKWIAKQFTALKEKINSLTKENESLKTENKTLKAKVQELEEKNDSRPNMSDSYMDKLLKERENYENQELGKKKTRKNR